MRLLYGTKNPKNHPHLYPAQVPAKAGIPGGLPGHRLFAEALLHPAAAADPAALGKLRYALHHGSGASGHDFQQIYHFRSPHRPGRGGDAADCRAGGHGDRQHLHPHRLHPLLFLRLRPRALRRGAAHGAGHLRQPVPPGLLAPLPGLHIAVRGACRHGL